MEKPIRLKPEEIDLAILTQICQEYIDFVDNDEEYCEDNDYDQYIFNTAVEAIFGSDVFDFVNDRRE